MKRTVTININGTVFYIDDDAFNRLKNYLDKLEQWFLNKESGQEIMSDIESRISELFTEKINPKKEVVNLQMVEEVIKIMGEPEDIFSESDEPTNSQRPKENIFNHKRSLYRDVDNKKIAGVCSGIAAYFNADPVIIRLLLILIALLSGGTVIFVYIILWAVVPPAMTTAQKLEMRGENITITNIEKAIKKEYEEVKKSFSKMKDSETYKKGESFFNRITKNKSPLLIILLVITALIVLSGITSGFHPNQFHIVFSSWHLPHIPFSGFFFLVLLLICVGFLFKPLLKTILYILLFLILAGITLKIIAILFGIGTAILFC